jgi:plasmid stabilization system protein ParE
MAQKIIWTEHASDDLGAIMRYIARHNPDAARNLGYGIYDRAQVVMEFPEAGSIVRELNHPDWRQVVFRSYRIVYHINRAAKTVEIVRVWHGARGDVELPKQS